jgi:hypothetical protein
MKNKSLIFKSYTNTIDGGFFSVYRCAPADLKEENGYGAEFKKIQDATTSDVIPSHINSDYKKTLFFIRTLMRNRGAPRGAYDALGIGAGDY